MVQSARFSIDTSACWSRGAHCQFISASINHVCAVARTIGARRAKAIKHVKRSRKMSLTRALDSLSSSLSPLWAEPSSELTHKRALACNISHFNTDEQFLEFRIQFWEDSVPRVFKSVATVSRAGSATVRTTESRRPSRVGGQLSITCTVVASWEDVQEMFERAVARAAAAIVDSQSSDTAANAFMAAVDADGKDF